MQHSKNKRRFTSVLLKDAFNETVEKKSYFRVTPKCMFMESRWNNVFLSECHRNTASDFRDSNTSFICPLIAVT